MKTIISKFIRKLLRKKQLEKEVILNPFIPSVIAEIPSLKMPDLEVPLTRHYGQRGEDLIVKSFFDALLLQAKMNYDQVWYLEIGANHPVATSSTYLLYEMGARGVLVEANPRLIDTLKLVRKEDQILNKAVVGSGSGNIDLFVSSADELSSTIESNLEHWPNHPVIEVIQVEKLEIAELLTTHYPSKEFHFLSIDCEGPDFEILERIDFNLYPFDVVQIEPSNHINLNATEGITTYLFYRGFRLISATEVNLLYIRIGKSDRKKSLDLRPFSQSRMSFDIFDTLITRRFKDPQSVLKNFCEKYGVDYEKRIKADNGERSLEKIYRYAEIPLEFMEKEIEMELENLIPIRSNLSKVNPHDVLVSDMYLSDSQLRRFLAKVDLQNNSLYVSNSDKVSGKYWKQLNIEDHPILHYGDNVISDYQNPMKFGIRAVLCNDSDLTDFELDVQRHNYHLAYLLRELRLSELDLNSTLSDRVSLSFNMSLMFAYCEILSKKKRDLVFLGRDCYQLYTIYSSYFGECEYLQFSREILTDLASASTRLKSVKSSNPLYVDLLSTGATWTKLGDEFEVVVLIRITDWSYDYVAPQLKNLSSIFTSEEVDFSIVLELLNPARQGRLREIDIGNSRNDSYSEHEFRPFEVEKLLFPSNFSVKRAEIYNQISGYIDDPRLLAQKSLNAIWNVNERLLEEFSEQIRKEEIHLAKIVANSESKTDPTNNAD